MSAEMVFSTNAVEIYVPLLNEGTDVLRPTTGLVLGANVVQVCATADYDATIEEWEFPPGSKVKCVLEVRGDRNVLVARHRVD
jgi:hypothetical protein